MKKLKLILLLLSLKLVVFGQDQSNFYIIDEPTFQTAYSTQTKTPYYTYYEVHKTDLLKPIVADRKNYTF